MWNHALSCVAFYCTRGSVEKLGIAMLHIATSLCRISDLNAVVVNPTPLSWNTAVFAEYNEWMPQPDWNAGLYDASHAFVWEFGRDLLSMFRLLAIRIPSARDQNKVSPLRLIRALLDSVCS